MATKFCLVVLAVALLVQADARLSGPARRLLTTTPTLNLRPGAPAFIVLLKDGAGAADLTRLLAVPGVTNVKHTYSSAAFYGFAADLTSLAQTLLRTDASVSLVGLNQPMLMQQGLAENWLSLGGSPVAINQERIGATDGTKVYKPAVIGIAILDTGIDLNDTTRFNVLDAKNCVTPGASAYDDNGHGTFIAGTVAGKTDDQDGVFGVAPGSWLVSVKVIDSTGVVDFADAICGINWLGN
jgi:subtilisin family serine protease